MKWFLLFLCLAAAEKLDRTYLPPPGAKFSGGAPGDIQAPFEIPKETYSTTLSPAVYDNGALSPEDTRIEVGINRGVPSGPGIPGNISPGSQTPDYYQNTFKVPTTTTSYAFTTTTTHPPGEAYETTTGLINPVTGLPITTFDYPISAPGFVNPDVYNPGSQPGSFQQNQVPGHGLSGRPTQYPSTTTLAPGSQSIDQNRPGFIQSSNIDLVSNQRPGVIPGLGQRPITGPSGTFPQYQGSQYQQVPTTFAPGTAAPTTFAPGTFAPTTFAPGTTPGSIQYGGDLNQGIIANQNTPFAQGNIPTETSSGQQGSYYPGQNQPQYVTQGQQLPQGTPQQYPITQTDEFGRPVAQNNVNQPFSTASPTTPAQGIPQRPGQVQYETNKGDIIPQQFLTQTDEFGRPVAQNNVYQPFSMASPTTPVPYLGQFTGYTPGSQASATTVYPSGSFPITTGIVGNQGIQTGLIYRPQRPQAEADRNAVILNYENVITPEGFAYSFDTSNGIHADENGTAVDGVKAKGSYSYIGDDGKLYSIVYTADENGFQPRGDHLPTSPPIPEAILKVIEQAKKDQESGVSDDGTYDEDKYGHTKYDGGRYRLQRPNKVNVDDETPDSYNGEYDQSNRRQQLKPQKETKQPVSTNQDYEDIGEEQGEVNGDGTVINGQRQPSYQKPSRRPTNRITNENNEQYNPETGEGSGDGFIDNKSSQYPIARPGGNRKQFGGKFSVQRPDQDSESDENYISPEQGSRGDITSPGYATSQNKYSTGGSRRRPIDSQSNQSPAVIFSDQGSNRRPQYDTDRRLFETVDDYNRPGSETSSQRPSPYPSETGVTSIPSDSQRRYGNRIRPVTSTAQPVDKTDSYNYQNSRRPGGLDKYLPNKGYIDQPVSSSTSSTPTSSQYSGSDDGKPQAIESISGQNYRPTSNRQPSKIPGSVVYHTTGAPVPVTGRPATDYVTSNQYNTSRGKPQSSTTAAVPQQGNEYYGNQIIETNLQNGRRPVPGRRPGETTRYSTVTPTNEEGYQYLPPQRKFSQESRRPGSQVISSNRKPSQDITYDQEGKIPKPFTTPDATRYEDGREDGYENIQDTNQSRRPQYTQVRPSHRPATTQQPYQTYEKESSQDRYDETRPQRPGLEQSRVFGTKIDAAGIPDQSDKITTIGSTRRPPYQQIQTTRPQQQSRPGSVYETTQGIPSGTLRPQESDRYFTTPVPSQSTRYELTQPSNLRPGQQTTDRYIPGQTPSRPDYFAQTTKLPVQSSGQYEVRPSQNVYEQTSSQSPIQTTYRPMVTYSGSDADKTQGTTARPRSPFGRPGYSENQVPSTTYRPAYYPGKVTEKQFTVDNFGRPLPQQPTGGEYRPGTSVAPGDISQDSQRPGQGLRPVDMYGRPTSSGQGNVPSYSGPEGSSTTEKIIGEDFSGPKQQQRFDPERGYYY